MFFVCLFQYLDFSTLRNFWVGTVQILYFFLVLRKFWVGTVRILCFFLVLRKFWVGTVPILCFFLVLRKFWVGTVKKTTLYLYFLPDFLLVLRLSSIVAKLILTGNKVVVVR